MHEVFLTRLAHHPILRNDNNFRVFLEYKEDVRNRVFKDFSSNFFKFNGIKKD